MRRAQRVARTRRERWQNLRDAFAVVGTLIGFSGGGLVGWGPVPLLYLGVALVLSGGMLMFCAAGAALRARAAREPAPPAMAVIPVRYHINDAPTVYVGDPHQYRRRP